MSTHKCNSDPRRDSSLLALRFEIPEAALILRMSRAKLYNRIGEGLIKAQKDGRRTYITSAELKRYVDACDSNRPVGPEKALASQTTLLRRSV